MAKNQGEEEIVPATGSGSYRDLDQLFGGVGEDLDAAAAEDDVVLDADPAPPFQVDAGFHGHHHAGLEGQVDPLRQPAAIVDLAPQAVAEPVAEPGAVAAGGDQVTGDLIRLLAGHPR